MPTNPQRAITTPKGMVTMTTKHNFTGDPIPSQYRSTTTNFCPGKVKPKGLGGMACGLRLYWSPQPWQKPACLITNGTAAAEKLPNLYGLLLTTLHFPEIALL